MRRKLIKLLAVILSIGIMLSLTGCMEMLEQFMQYEDFSDYGQYGFDLGFTSYTDQPMGGNGTPQTPVTISENQLSQAVRDQFTKLKGNGNDVVTIMVYMCASNLESSDGMASEDIKEMMRATESEKLNIVIETGGSKKWFTPGISTNNQRHIIRGGKLTTVDNSVGRAIMTEADSLTDFITFCNTNYPADRNMLILWDHGAGAVDGWGYDEFGGYDTMTIDELGEALYNAQVKFDMIGFDACLMSTMEVACVLYDFADYMIASEDYESGYGWEYQNFLSQLSNNTSIPTPELAKTVCDDFVKESGQTSAILAAFDLSYMKLVYTAWRDFAYAAEPQLLDSNFSWETENEGGRISIDDLAGLFSTTSNIQDMVAIANSVKNVPESEALLAALGNCTLYCSANSADAHMTGMAVTLPYGDSGMYKDIKKIFANAGFEQEYIDFLGKFVSVSQSGQYDWSDWFNMWDGWDDYDYGSDFGWGDWSGWEQYNNDDYGWSDYDYYDYETGGSDYGYDYYDFFNIDDFFNTDNYGNGDYGYDDYGFGSYGSGDYGNDYSYTDGDDYGIGDLLNYFFGQ